MILRRAIAVTGACAVTLLLASAPAASGAVVVQRAGAVITAQGTAGAETTSFAVGTQAVEFSDPGGASPGPGCPTSQPAPFRMSCPTDGVTTVELNTGEGDDTVGAGAVGALAGTVRGGPGNDTINQSAIASQPGTLLLLGEDGNDVIQLLGGSAIADGGTGDDRFTYSPLAGAVSVARGGPGNDRFDAGHASSMGTTPPERADTIDAGDGDDVVDVGDFLGMGAADTVDCGPGTDTVVADSADRIVNCEIVTRTSSIGGPPAASALPRPVTGRSVNVEVVRGVVTVRRPGGRAVRLRSGEQIPVGSVVDTRRGAVRLTVAGAGGVLESGVFFDGLFKVTQSHGARPITELRLVEVLAPCRTARAGSVRAAAARGKRAKSRRLWGDGKGAFRTRGRRSSAIVSGTKWLVQDSCAGTLTRVTRGRVRVRDFVKRRTVTVRAIGRYVAR